VNTLIQTDNLQKTYRIHRKEAGLTGSVRSFFHRRYEEVAAVKPISLAINEGELVGFIGPNGAGKTTTLKMLSGLLHPTAGSAQVLGFTPWERRKAFLKQISLVMGQKHQLWWDLSLSDSLLLQRDIYEMNETEFKSNLEQLTALLDLKPILNIQVRKLSLGQRMRGELAAALIYRPKLLFLDEPTIGLDVVVQHSIRQFIADYRKRHNATIVLTSHYLDDVRELCERLLIIDHGQIMFDGSPDSLIANHINHKLIVLTFAKRQQKKDLLTYGRITEYEPLKASLQVPRERTSAVAGELLAKFPIHDISIEEPSLEDVVRELFTKHDYA
jgi:ABC-2 type transport system ATP-binding protein